MKRKPLILLIVSLLSLMIAKEVSSTNSKTNFKINFIPAKTTNELLDIKANPRANIIKTLPDFNDLVNSYNTPFSKLSPDELQTFRKNLVFRNGKGVASIDYHVIKNKLNAQEFAEVMTYFGIDTINGYWGLSTNTKVLEDIRGGAVASLGDEPGQACSNKICVKLKDNICLSACGS